MTIRPTTEADWPSHRKHGFAFIDEWEPLASHPHIQVQTMSCVKITKWSSVNERTVSAT